MLKVCLFGADTKLGKALQKELEEYNLIIPEIDITKLNDVRDYILDEEPNLVISTVLYTKNYPKKSFDINTWATKNLAEVCKEANARFVWRSSSFVFDGKKRFLDTPADSKAPYKKDNIPFPKSSFGMSVFQGERYIQTILDNHYIIRTTDLFGEGGKNGFIEDLLETNKDKVPNNIYRQYSYAKDVAQRIHQVVFFGSYGLHHAINDYEDKTSLYNIAQEIIDNPIPTAAKRKVNPFLTDDKPLRSYKKALDDYKSYYNSTLRK